MSKLARRNQAKQLRLHHHEKKQNEDSIFQGRDGAAKHVAVVPLSRGVDITAAIKQLNESVDINETVDSNGATRIKVDRFRRNLLYIPAKRDLLNALDVCRLADWVVFVSSAEQEIDEVDDLLLRSIEGQGITNVVVVVQGLERILPQNKRPKVLTASKEMMSRYFSSLDKVYALENKADSANLVRTLCTAASKGIRWRDERSWMLVEAVQWGETPPSDDKGSVVLSGVVRGRGMNPDRLVHVPGWGDFQIDRITEIPKENVKRKMGAESAMDVVSVEYRPTDDRDNLEALAPEEANMTDATSTMATNEHKGVLLDDHHYFEDDYSHIPPPPKRLPKGTSSYQAAWYLDELSDSGSDIMDEEEMGEDVAMNAVEAGPEDGAIANGVDDAMTEAGPTEYPESEMHVDASPDDEAADLEAFRASRKNEADEDLEFPDEIELHPNMLARERLAKYRGLKSLHTSEWNTEADTPYEPEEYRRLLQIPDYKKSKSQAVREALAGGIAVGTRVEVELVDVPLKLKTAQPTCIFSLLRHEHKHTVVNLNLTLSSDVEAPLKSKEELIVQIGPRRFTINPVFSAAGNTPNDVHKFDRFVHPGRAALASFIGPVTWGAVPVLVYRMSPESPQGVDLIGTATTIPSSTSRIIAKRIILTGHPYKIHKKLVTVRYMFFNDEDVAWFSALPLWTKRGRQGFIKESLGTHGYFKATFDGKINPMDAVGVSLYKRVWPRIARPWHGPN